MCCGEQAHGEGNVNRASECKAYAKSCARCGKLNHYAAMCRSQRSTPPRQQTPQPQVSETAVDEVPDISGFICNLAGQISNPAEAVPVMAELRRFSSSPVTVLPVPHHVYDRDMQRWNKQPPKPSPVIQVTVSVDS